MDYRAVTKALKDGRDPVMLCTTCPWDRMCISPPEMTAGDVEKAMAEAKQEDLKAQAKRPGSVPMASAVTALMLGDADTRAQLCPVLAMRLRLPVGRQITDDMKKMMQVMTE